MRFPPFPSYSSLSTRHDSSPKRRGTRETRERALPSHLFDKQGVNCSTHQQTLRVWAFMLDESCLLCSNVQTCAHASQVCIRFELYSTIVQVCVSTVQVWYASGVLCPQCRQVQLPLCKCLGQDFFQPLDHEFLLADTSNESSCFPSNTATTKFH